MSISRRAMIGQTHTVAEWQDMGIMTGKFVRGGKRKGKITYTDIGGCTGNGKVRAMGMHDDYGILKHRVYYIKWGDKMTLVQ